VTWNVRGLNEKEKRLRIRSFIRDWKAKIVCLLETKFEYISREVIHSLWGMPTSGLDIFGVVRGIRWDFVNVE